MQAVTQVYYYLYISQQILLSPVIGNTTII